MVTVIPIKEMTKLKNREFLKVTQLINNSLDLNLGRIMF